MASLGWVPGGADSDGDRIPNRRDRCPTKAETVNGYQDEDGCPDDPSPKVEIKRTVIATSESIYFDTDKWDIKRRSRRLLAKLAAAIKWDKKIRVVYVEGHADMRGTEKYNQWLSYKRAKAVVRYLRLLGVSRYRLRALGWGQQRPRDMADTPRGLARNRQVRFHVERRRRRLKVRISPPTREQSSTPKKSPKTGSGRDRPTQSRPHKERGLTMIARVLGMGVLVVLMVSSSVVWAQVDTDGDTISDVDEGVAISRDSDKDGIPDYRDADSDGDGISDAIEAGDAVLATPPRDTDKDGIPDYLDVDSDNDRLPDALEDANGNGVVDFDETNSLDPDSDHDGLKDGDEDLNLNGQVDAGEADPRNPDSDGDGFLDGVDACPSQAEDVDGLQDTDGCPETDADSDGIDDTVEQGHACLDPLKADTDSDGLKDGAEDRDGDGVVDPGESDPCKTDTDGDGLIDGIDQCPTQPEDFDGDRDRDGCPDPESYPDAGGGRGP